MKKTWAIGLLVMSSVGVAGLELGALHGDWLGALNVAGQRLRLVLHLRQTEAGGWKAIVDSVDQGAFGLPVDEVTVQENQIRLELRRIGAQFRGEWREGKGEIQGFWQQGGMTLPLTFKRAPAEGIVSRPQEPRPPFPYRQEEVSIRNERAAITLAGTLTCPETKGTKNPAVLLVSGSGPQDRDGTVAGHRPFLVLADHLTRSGFVVLRMDDRGVGKSEGNLAAATLEELAADVQVAVQFLKGRDEVDPQRVVLLGHSLGGIVAAMVARDEQLAGLVLLAAPALAGDALLHLQSERLLEASGAGKRDMAKAREINSRVYEIVAKSEDQESAGEQIRSILREQAVMPPEAVEVQLRTLLSPSFRSFLLFDPEQVFPHVKVPLLALYGGKDLQVPGEENSAALRALLPREASVPQEVQILRGLNHLFQECRKGTPEEYGTIEQTISPKVLKIVSSWLLQRVLPGKA